MMGWYLVLLAAEVRLLTIYFQQVHPGSSPGTSPLKPQATSLKPHHHMEGPI